MPGTETIKASGTIPALKSVGVLNDPHPTFQYEVWLYSELDPVRSQSVDNLPDDLFLRFSNLPTSILQRKRVLRWDVPVAQSTLKAYRSFLQRWGLLDRRRVLSVGSRTRNAGGPWIEHLSWGSNHSENQDKPEFPDDRFFPQELAASAKRAKEGFLAIKASTIWYDIQEFRLMFQTWSFLRNGETSDLRKAMLFYDKINDAMSDRHTRPGESERFWNSVSVGEAERQFLSAFLRDRLKGPAPRLDFLGTEPLLRVTYDSLMPLMEQQLLQTILAGSTVKYCPECGNAFVPKRNTRIYCPGPCAHRVAQRAYWKRP